MKRLDYCFIILKFVHRDVTHAYAQLCVVGSIHVNFGSRKFELLKSSFHLWLPFLHHRIEVWHIFCVIHCGGWACLVQVLDSIDPPRNVFWLLVSLLNRVHIHRRSANNIL